MYHYFNSLTNTRGDALIGYFVKAIDVVTNSEITIYADANATPIVSVSGVDNAARVDSDGNLSFYLNTSGDFNLDVYATDATTFVKRFTDMAVAVGPTGAQGPAGDVAKAADRTALAATVATAGLTRYLAETGREGTFVFDSTNISANVSGGFAFGDTQQGVYVLPASDLTGASGAWVRKFTGPHNVKWFGAKGDNVTNDGAAVLAALGYLLATSRPLTYGFHAGGSASLFFPSGTYYLGASTLEIYATMRLVGEGVGDAGATPTVLRWDANTCGLRVHNVLTASFNGKLGVARLTCGDASIIEGIFFEGGYTNATATPENDQYPAIQLRARATIRDCFFNNWQGDAIYAHASGSAGDGANPPYGNVNNWKVERCASQNTRDGLSLSGADSNAGYSLGFQVLSSRRHGIWDDSFLGNTHVAPLTQSCSGTAENGVALPASIVSDGTNRYGVIAGQSVGASTNAPTSGATNTWWYFIGAGGASSSNGIPLWTSGMAVREGFPYYSTQAAAHNRFIAPYSESSQAPNFAQLSTQVFAPTGLNSNPWLRTDNAQPLDGVLTALATGGLTANGKFLINGTFQVLGATSQIGPQSGTAAANTVNLDNTSTQNSLQLRSWSAGVSQIDAKIISLRGGATNGNLLLDGIANGAAGSVVLRSGGVERFRTDANRATVAAGFPLNLAPGAAPGTPSNGDIWYDSTLATFRKRVNGITLNLTQTQSFTFATLPASPTVGQREFITDCTVNTFGTAAAGGGTNKVPVYYDGAWKVG
jgi:hypothetical protein